MAAFSMGNDNATVWEKQIKNESYVVVVKLQ